MAGIPRMLPPLARRRRDVQPGAFLAAFFLLVSMGTGLAFPALAADDLGQALALDPPEWSVDGIDLKLGGFATGAGYTEHQTSGPALRGSEDTNVTGQVRANATLERTFDDGIQLGIKANALVVHDTLSDDRYGNDTIERVYLYGRMAYGTLELGEQDGVGEQLGLTGPRLDPRVSLDDPDTTFFIDPSTGKRFDHFFRPFVAEDSSSVAAKINYLSPRLFGLQLGASFTPAMVKAPLPFAGNPSDGPDGQQSLWELAANYSTFFGDLGLGGSLAYLHGTLDHGTPGHDNLQDFAIGAQAVYMLSDLKLSLGGGYRQSNAYEFHPNLVFDHGDTKLWHLAFMTEDGPWRAGLEYSNGDIGGAAALPDYGMTAYQAAVGYRVNDNLDLAAGWQWYNYDRNSGVFYNGDDTIHMNAGFLTLNYGL